MQAPPARPGDGVLHKQAQLLNYNHYYPIGTRHLASVPQLAGDFSWGKQSRMTTGVPGRSRSARHDQARKIKATLDEAQARLLGTVLSDREFPIPERIYRRLGFPGHPLLQAVWPLYCYPPLQLRLSWIGKLVCFRRDHSLLLAPARAGKFPRSGTRLRPLHRR